jgi:large subunit ribosomal protein L23
MDLTIYEVIKGPWVTAKAYALNQLLKQLVLEVHPHANKPQVEEALKKLFNVETDTIRMVVVKGKMRRSGRRYVAGKQRKKAVVTLKAGYSIDLTAWAPSSADSSQRTAQV